MKIAVMTLPLSNNYGGNLQAFALVKLLKNLGYEPIFINLKRKITFKIYFKFIIKNILGLFIVKYKNPTFPIKRTKQMASFIDRYIFPKTDEIFSSVELEKICIKEKFDACIVGSDQVFRPEYFWLYKDSFSLGFLNDNVIKLSYAASFGGAKYSGDNKEFHAKNFKKFRAISVREKSGIKVCKETFGVDATWVLDPTMMLEIDEYKKLFKDIKASNSKGRIFAYVLDKSLEKQTLINNFAKDKNLEIYEINDGNLSSDIISIEEWLKSIYEADTIITDSFHGCVFSILFNKPFYAFINKERGADRFYSLFEMFDLFDRIIDCNNFSQKNINYKKVNEIIKEQKELSKKFLISNLKVDNAK
ncbi:polysaccharide pyruvyl transferase family protein [Campylobacter ureolyticus]|uniref:polysaccharide pyruvyl transferase family protein n=1 Tax=Campylobacter ureolyticus TaxID=827 RepID=UPI0022B44DC9|nr:polysaccharide pyruvyl transferase family protein [Campylobacter ureolyticus]MCZ6173749.1 polysaccharide pyruvyl transferase family protein [Campylobacter ureolyticus]MCZ6186316.1 polysaccharide pyruvyl transferase family protein [Campylobacter ureolyticus]